MHDLCWTYDQTTLSLSSGKHPWNPDSSDIIGVIYQVNSERWSHYSKAVLPTQDGLLYLG